MRVLGLALMLALGACPSERLPGYFDPVPLDADPQSALPEPDVITPAHDVVLAPDAEGHLLAYHMEGTELVATRTVASNAWAVQHVEVERGRVLRVVVLQRAMLVHLR